MMEMSMPVCCRHRRRRLEGEDVGAGAAEDQGQRGRVVRPAGSDRLGDPQGQPEAAAELDEFYVNAVKKQGLDLRTGSQAIP